MTTTFSCRRRTLLSHAADAQRLLFTPQGVQRGRSPSGFAPAGAKELKSVFSDDMSVRKNTLHGAKCATVGGARSGVDILLFTAPWAVNSNAQRTGNPPVLCFSRRAVCPRASILKKSLYQLSIAQGITAREGITRCFARRAFRSGNRPRPPPRVRGLLQTRPDPGRSSERRRRRSESRRAHPMRSQFQCP